MFTDEQQLDYAAKNGYILLSHNKRHFQTLHKDWMAKQKTHSGIVVISFAEPERLAVRVKVFFEEMHPNLKIPFCVSPPNLGNAPLN